MTSLPSEVAWAIDSYYATPIKEGRNGEKHDIGLSSLRRVESDLLAALICDLKPAQSLEIGLAEGGSCIAITAARASAGLAATHTALDPFQETLSHGTGLRELERLGLRQQMNWQPEFSENYLNAAHARGEKFDFIFVDGGHDIGQKVTDAFYIGKLLRPGGVVAFHDGMLTSTSFAVRHLVKECGFTILALPADAAWKRAARAVRHAPRLGAWYVANVIKHLCRSVVALKKNE